MSDTPQSRSYLLGRYADQTTGDITPRDGRLTILSVPMQAGAWSSATSYLANDVVSYGMGGVAWALANSTADDPATNASGNWWIIRTPGSGGGSNGSSGVGVSSAAVNSSGHLVLNLTDGSSLDAGSVVGPTGPTGTTGGALVTVSVGTVVTGSPGSGAAVTIDASSTSTNTVLDFVVPAGATGPTGPAGAAGSNASGGAVVWSSATAYAAGSFVFDAGSLWVAVGPTTDDQPGTSSTGNWVQVSVGGTIPSTAPDAPGSLTATAGNARVILAWTATSGTYTVGQATTGGGPYTTVATGLAAPTHTVTGLANGTAYHFVVTATNLIGPSSASTEVTATPDAGIGLIVNHSFEAPDTTGGPGFEHAPPGSGFTWSDPGGGDGAGIASVTGGYTFPTAPDGIQVAYFADDGSWCEQAVGPLTIGTSYTLTYSACARTGYSGGTVAVALDGSTVDTATPGPTWAARTVTFTAAAAYPVLRFTKTGGSSFGVDNLLLS